MAKASPDTNNPREILSYQLSWNTAGQGGKVRVIVRNGSHLDIVVKSFSEMASLAEILRTEKPMFVAKVGPGSQDFAIQTGEEPTGEEDRG